MYSFGNRNPIRSAPQESYWYFGHLRLVGSGLSTVLWWRLCFLWSGTGVMLSCEYLLGTGAAESMLYRNRRDENQGGITVVLLLGSNRYREYWASWHAACGNTRRPRRVSLNPTRVTDVYGNHHSVRRWRIVVSVVVDSAQYILETRDVWEAEHGGAVKWFKVLNSGGSVLTAVAAQCMRGNSALMVRNACNSIVREMSLSWHPL